MRNLRRLQFEMGILRKIFGSRNISYPSDGSWIKISNYELPRHNCAYNFRFTAILIIIPDEYGSVGVSECYIDRDLKVKKGLKLERLPHTQNGKYNKEGYQWLCFEASNKFVSLLDFINTLKLYFNNPFRYQRL